MPPKGDVVKDGQTGESYDVACAIFATGRDDIISGYHRFSDCWMDLNRISFDFLLWQA